MSTPKQNLAYYLQTGEQAAVRLNLQHKWISEGSEAHVLKTNIREGHKVMDLGCGSGTMTGFLAKQVGPTGRVYAVDMSQKQLDMTRKVLEEQGINNVEYVLGNIEETDSEFLQKLAGQMDIVYTRYVLMHLKESTKAATNIAQLLKSGGQVASQESIISSTHCEPEDPLITRQYAVRQKLTELLGSDPNIGKKLKELFEMAGFTTHEYYIFQYRLPLNGAAENLRKGLDETKDKYIEAGLFTAENIEETISRIDELEKTNGVLVFDQGYIIATKN